MTSTAVHRALKRGAAHQRQRHLWTSHVQFVRTVQAIYASGAARDQVPPPREQRRSLPGPRPSRRTP